MQQSRLIIIVVCLILGFASGFVLRPIIAPAQPAMPIAAVAPAAPALSKARGTQYFAANIEEARRIVARCRDGSVRGAECANAEEAIITADSAERQRRFVEN